MFAPVKIDCNRRVTTDSILGYIEIKMKKALKRLRIKAFYMVGVTGFEPMASWSRTKRDTKLRHTPKCFKNYILLPRKLQELF